MATVALTCESDTDCLKPQLICVPFKLLTELDELNGQNINKQAARVLTGRYFSPNFTQNEYTVTLSLRSLLVLPRYAFGRVLREVARALTQINILCLSSGNPKGRP